MIRRRLSLTLLLAFLIAIASEAQMKRSPKRGLCENNPHYTAAWTRAICSGVSWTYNWGISPEPNGLHSAEEGGILFAPMCWDHQFDEKKLRNFLTKHPETRLLLGFNEPNFKSHDGGASMIPSLAAKHWTRVEKIAEDFGLELASPAVNFGYEALSDGRVWGLDEWLGAFIEEYRKANNGRDPRMDYIALHSYMNWAGSIEWFVNTYPYASDRDARLLAYFERNGRKKVLLTEFCAGEGDKDGFTTTVDSQIDQMVQKVQILEKSDNVAGYAWFMGIGGSFTNSFPYFHVFAGSDENLQLTELGLIYANMSSFDRNWYFKPGQLIPATDYMNMSECQIRHSTDSESPCPIELSRFQQYLNWNNEAITPYVEYQINVGTSKRYTLSMRLCNSTGTNIDVYVDGKKKATVRLTSTGGQWATQTTTVSLTPGNHILRLANVKQADNRMNWLRIEGDPTDTTEQIPDAIDMRQQETQPRSTTFFDLSGRPVAFPQRGLYLRTNTLPDGSLHTEKVLMK